MAKRYLSLVIMSVAILIGASVFARWEAEKSIRDLVECNHNLEELQRILISLAPDGVFRNSNSGQVRGLDCPGQLRAALIPRYFQRMPTCPAAGRDTYSDTFCLRSDYPWDSQPGFFLQCRGGHHRRAGIPSCLPAISNTDRGARNLAWRHPVYPRAENHNMKLSSFAINGLHLGILSRSAREVPPDQITSLLPLSFNRAPCEMTAFADSSRHIVGVYGDVVSSDGKEIMDGNTPQSEIADKIRLPYWEYGVMRIYEDESARFVFPVYDGQLLCHGRPVKRLYFLSLVPGSDETSAATGLPLAASIPRLLLPESDGSF